MSVMKLCGSFLLMLMICSTECVQAQTIRPVGHLPELHHPILPYSGAPHVHAPATLKQHARSGSGQIIASYSGFNDQQRQAFAHAVAIWNSLLDLNADIEISAAMYTPSSSNTLGSAGALFHVSRDFGNNTYWLTGACANQVYRRNYSGTEIRVRMARRSDWYYGLEVGAISSGQIDFVSVAMHEIGHGLGFAGSARADEDGCGTDDLGCYGRNAPNSDTYIDLYDSYVRDANSVRIDDIPNYSDSTKRFLEGRAFPSPARAAVGTLILDAPSFTSNLYTPSNWQAGSSYSHFTNSSEMMYHSFSRGQIKRNPGRALDLLEDMGFSLGNGILPVTLTSFEASPGSGEVDIIWQTNNEISSSHFNVQRSDDGEQWTDIHFEHAQGYRMTPTFYKWRDRLPLKGTNLYRLQMVDEDGSYSYSEIVIIEMAETPAWSIYPTLVDNNFTILTNATEGSYRILDLSGRTLLRGRISNRHTQVELWGLSPGMYLVDLKSDKVSQQTLKLVKQ